MIYVGTCYVDAFLNKDIECLNYHFNLICDEIEKGEFKEAYMYDFAKSEKRFIKDCIETLKKEFSDLDLK